MYLTTVLNLLSCHFNKRKQKEQQENRMKQQLQKWNSNKRNESKWNDSKWNDNKETKSREVNTSNPWHTLTYKKESDRLYKFAA